jgi:hypothetical protein
MQQGNFITLGKPRKTCVEMAGQNLLHISALPYDLQQIILIVSEATGYATESVPHIKM